MHTPTTPGPASGAPGNDGGDTVTRAARALRVFDGMADGLAVYECTPDGLSFLLRDANATWRDIHRVAGDESTGNHSGENGAHHSTPPEVLQRVLDSGQPERISWRPEGTDRRGERYADFVQRLSTTELLVVTRDNSARHATEEALRESREVLHGILNAIPVRVFWKDRDLKYLGCNAAFAGDAGFERPEQLIGKDDFAMGWRAQAELYRADDRRIIESGATRLLYEEPQTTPSGEQIHLLTSKLPLRNAKGGIVGVLGTYYDISPLRRAERDYRTLFEEMLDGFALHELIYDDTGVAIDYRFMAVNPAFERILGIAAEKLLGRTVLEVLPGLDRSWIEKYDHVVQTGEPAHFEQFSRELGKYFRVAAFRPAPGQFACIVADISERRRLEDQLAQSEKLRAVGQLASGIAHEINTPAQFVGDNLRFLSGGLKPLLDLVSCYREVLAALPPSPEYTELRARVAAGEAATDVEFLRDNVPEALESAGRGIARISAIVRAMREFAHPDSSVMDPTDLNHAIESTLTICRNEYRLVADVETDFGELPPVMCFPGELNQVFLNLIVNAAQAIAEVVRGSGRRGVISVRSRHEERRVRITISDTGCGIPAAIRERIFEPFFTTKPVGQGTGQGLALSYAIVVGKHGGTLSFESAAGSGTTFTILLDVEGKPGNMEIRPAA